MKSSYFRFISKLEFCDFSYCLKESIKIHISFMLVRLTKNKVKFLFRVLRLLICHRVWNKNLCILKHLVKFRRFQECCVQSISKRCIIIEKNSQTFLNFIDLRHRLREANFRSLICYMHRRFLSEVTAWRHS